jgi:Cu-Zn family superoxide dismutase
VLLVVPMLVVAACGGDEPLPEGDDDTAAAATTEPDDGAAGRQQPPPSEPGGAPGAGPAAGSAPAAVAELLDREGHGVGLVTFTPVEGNERATDVAVELIAEEMPPNTFHGFHIHANDRPSNGRDCVADPDDSPPEWFVSADGHLGAEDSNHGAHMGDMPSLLVGEGGVASARFTTERFVVDDVIGAAVIVHAEPDNFGNVPLGDGPEDFQPNSREAVETTGDTGNSGPRLACGVVEVGSGGAGNPAR